MEPIEQFNENFNVKKPKKKGLIIGGIAAAVVIVALVLVYFLVLSNPKFIFNKAIDKLLAVNSEQYDSVKVNAEIKASVEAEDITYQTQLSEIEKYKIKFGTQMDLEAKKEIVDLGLEYDNQAVIDAQVYYNNGEMYAYLEGLFDKYIQMDMDEETKAALDEVFSSVNSEDMKNAEKAVNIIRDELKAQINEKGEFAKEKETIDVADNEEKVTKTTLKLTQKELYSLVADMCLNLADNDEFIDYFGQKELADALEEIAELIKDEETNNKNYAEISLYTKGLLNSNLVAVDLSIYSADDASTVVVSVVKEDEGVYSYKVSAKASGIKMDFLKGKVEIDKDKDSKEEQSGKATITAEVVETGSAKLEIDYAVEVNKGIDKVDTSNSVNMNSLTQEDMQAIMTKLMERPLIGQLISNEMNGLGTEVEPGVEDDFLVDPDTETNVQNNLTTSQNEVKDEEYGYSVTYSVPAEFEYDDDYSYDDMKFYELENADYSYVDATVSLDWSTESEYVQDEIKWDYDYYMEETEYYKNVNLSEVKTITVGDKTFKYVVLSYETSYDTKCQDAYVWYVLDNEYMFTIHLEASDTTVTEDVIKGFLNINVTELN
ncbi:MAG: hypothetical protein IJE59_01215 [Clostridia bacterium]|nr:hypothetical protein [Clostridia bacterium]